MAAELEGDTLPSVENLKIHEEVKKTEKNTKVESKKINEKELEDFLMG